MINISETLLAKVNGDELLTLCHIARRVNKSGECFPSLETLRKDTGLGRDSMNRVIQSLCKKGIMEKVQKRVEKGVFSVNTYRITTKHISVFVNIHGTEITDQPTTENQDTVQPATDLPATAEPTTVNQYTKYYSILEVLDTTTTTHAHEEKNSNAQDNPLPAPQAEKVPAVNVATLKEAINAQPNSEHLQATKAICQQRGLNYETQLNDYCLAIIHTVSGPIGLKESCELRKRFWQSVRNYSKPINSSQNGTETTATGRKSHSQIIAERMGHFRPG